VQKNMSTTIMEAQLRDALDRDRELAVRGCATASGPAGIAVERRGTPLGVWQWRNGGFELRLAGEGEAVTKVETVAEAVHHTRERLFKA
jgi:hypothetical protein